MKKEMMAYCGTYCETCEWKEKTNCKGCKANAGDMFWGECKVAKCAIEKELNHCGECDRLPCVHLLTAFSDPEHGDNGERLINLTKWANNEESTCPVTKPV